MADIRYRDVSERGKLSFTGPQRAWFLHQIVTQHFEQIAPGESRAAAMLTAKGRMVGFFEAVATDDAILIHFEESLRATFPAEFERYVFATQVEIADVTDQMGLVVLLGESWERIADDLGALAVQETVTFGRPAGYVWLRSSEVPAALRTLGGLGEEISEDGLEDLRIEAGIPRWGRDMDARSIPQEAGLEDFGALDFDKGCYVGQETVAKIHFRGKVNRKIRRLKADGVLPVGAEVRAGEEEVGAVTSSSGRAALALLKHTVEPGEEVTVSGVSATVL